MLECSHEVVAHGEAGDAVTVVRQDVTSYQIPQVPDLHVTR